VRQGLFSIKALRNVHKYINKQITFLFTAMNTVRGKTEVIPERDGKINSLIRVEITGFYRPKVTNSS